MFAYKLYMNPDAPVVSRAEFQKLENVDNPDKYTVIYNYRSAKQAAAFLADPDPWRQAKLQLHRNLCGQKKPVISITYSEIGTIYPEHVLGKIPPAKIPESDVARAPIGTGPYKVDHWTTGQEIVSSRQYQLHLDRSRPSSRRSQRSSSPMSTSCWLRSRLATSTTSRARLSWFPPRTPLTS